MELMKLLFLFELWRGIYTLFLSRISTNRMPKVILINFCSSAIDISWVKSFPTFAFITYSIQFKYAKLTNFFFFMRLNKKNMVIKLMMRSSIRHLSTEYKKSIKKKKKSSWTNVRM